jgi:hypothetical protein
MHAWLLHGQGHVEAMHVVAGMHYGPEACRFHALPEGERREGNSEISASHMFMCENGTLVLKAYGKGEKGRGKHAPGNMTLGRDLEEESSRVIIGRDGGREVEWQLIPWQ